MFILLVRVHNAVVHTDVQTLVQIKTIVFLANYYIKSYLYIARIPSKYNCVHKLLLIYIKSQTFTIRYINLYFELFLLHNLIYIYDFGCQRSNILKHHKLFYYFSNFRHSYDVSNFQSIQ